MSKRGGDEERDRSRKRSRGKPSTPSDTTSPSQDTENALKKVVQEQLEEFEREVVKYEDQSKAKIMEDMKAVSYTHLTLPTNREV